MGLKTSLYNLLLAYSPFIRGEKSKIKQIRILIKKIKESKNDFFDPVQRNFTGSFGKYISELHREAEYLKKVYLLNFNGSEKQQQDFEYKLVNAILFTHDTSMEDFSFKKILRMAITGKDTEIKNIDGIFTLKLKFFTNNMFKKYRNDIVGNLFIADLVSTNLKSILDAFPQKNGESFDKLPVEDIKAQILDLYYVTYFLTQIKISDSDPVFREAFAGSELAETSSIEEALSHRRELLNSYTQIIKNNLLLDIIRLSNNDPSFIPEYNVHTSNFPDNIKSSLIIQFKKYRHLYIQNENQKHLNFKIKSLFGDNKLQQVSVYNIENSNLFNEHGLPVFKYINPFRICKSFFNLFFNPQIRPVFQEFLVEAEFSNTNIKNDLNNILDNIMMINDKIGKFEEDLNIPSFSEIHPHVERLRKGIIEKSATHKAIEATENLNKRADKIIQETFKYSLEFHSVFSKIINEIETRNPELLTNTMFLNNKKGELCQRLEQANDYFIKFISLLKMFSINVSETKDNLRS